MHPGLLSFEPWSPLGESYKSHLDSCGLLAGLPRDGENPGSGLWRVIRWTRLLVYLSKSSNRRNRDPFSGSLCHPLPVWGILLGAPRAIKSSTGTVMVRSTG